MKNEHCIEVCNRLLRGEQSAVGAYAKAIVSFKDSPVPPELQEILDDHREAVLALNKNVRSMDGQPSPGSGAWGHLAGTVQAAAGAISHSAVIASVLLGEKAGKKDYEAALADDDVMDECKNLIRSDLLVAVNSHIETLESLSV